MAGLPAAAVIQALPPPLGRSRANRLGGASTGSRAGEPPGRGGAPAEPSSPGRAIEREAGQAAARAPRTPGMSPAGGGWWAALIRRRKRLAAAGGEKTLRKRPRGGRCAGSRRLLEQHHVRRDR